MEKRASSYLSLAQRAASNQKMQTVGQSITLSQTYAHNQRTRRINQTLWLVNASSYTYGVANVSVSQALNMQQTCVPRSHEVSTYNAIIFWHRAGANDFQSVQQHLVFNQTATTTKSKAGSNRIVFVGTVSRLMLRNLDTVQTFTIEDGATVVHNDYRVVLLPNPPSSVANTVTFNYNNGNCIVTLRTPDFGNKNTVNINRIYRKTDLGEIRTGRDPDWPRSRTYSLTFSALNRQKCDELRWLFNLTLGKEVVYTNHLGEDHTGIIMNPGTEFQEYARDQYRVTIELKEIL